MKTSPLRKLKKTLKDKLEAQQKDFKQPHNDFSVKCGHYLDAKQGIVELTTKLDASKIEIAKLTNSFYNVEFNFKKFDVSSTAVESMIVKQLKCNDERGEGIGYNVVPPPYNNNYFGLPLTKEEEDREQFMQYGTQSTNETVCRGSINSIEPNSKVKDTNASTSRADKVTIEDGVDFMMIHQIQ